MHKKAREAGDLIAKACAFQVETSEDLKLIFSKIDNSPELRSGIKAEIAGYFQKESGASSKILQKMKVLGF
jgi:hypothetical protein